MENKDKEELDRLKENYKIKQILFNLPEYKGMAEEFEIEKVAEKETEFLLREIRRVIVEKLSAYIHLFETILNPSSGSLMIFSIIKNIKEERKKEIQTIYKKLAKIQLSAVKLDTVYNEKAEAEFIIQIYNEWAPMKEKLFIMFEDFEKDFDITNSNNANCYFG